MTAGYVLAGSGSRLAELVRRERKNGADGYLVIPVASRDGSRVPTWVDRVTLACMDLWRYDPLRGIWTRQLARCTWCARPGEPYIYRGREFSGLCAYQGDRLCPPCRDARLDAEGADILVADGRPGIPPYVVNTVRDRDTIRIFMPPDLRGVDGRDLARRRPARRRPPRAPAARPGLRGDSPAPH